MPTTRWRWLRCSKEKLGFADGVYSPEMDAKLGFNVFTAPVEVATVETRSLAPTTRVALVIGNGAYQNPGARLVNPPNDARAVSAELEKLGFRVDLHVDKNRRGDERGHQPVRRQAAERR